VIFGAGGHAKVIVDIIERQGIYTISGFLDDYKEPKSEIYGYEVLGGKDFIREEVGDVSAGIVALGDNWLRKTVVEEIKRIKPNFRFISAIHPSSSVGRGVIIQEGSVVMAGSIINSDAEIGEHCIINTKSSVGHDAILSDFVTVAPNATVAGGSKIGECTTMSMSSSVIHGKEIGAHTVIGAGATVLDNIPSFVVAYGTPAKVIRTRVESDRYL